MILIENKRHLLGCVADRMDRKLEESKHGLLCSIGGRVILTSTNNMATEASGEPPIFSLLK